MKRNILLILAAALLPAQTPNAVSPEQAAQGWILLFDGTSLFGWTAFGGADWKAADGVIRAASGETGWLLTNAAFGDFVLRCDFRTAADGNSGLFLRSSREGRPWVSGYELQIYDQHEKFKTGSLVGDILAEKAAIRPGQWQSYEVTVTGDHFVVVLDGRKVLDGRNSKSRSGHIGLQFNKDKPIEFRNVMLRPLGGKNLIAKDSLAGWKKVNSPKPAATPPVWTVKDAVIHVEKGPGQLETEGTFQNFVLQMDIRTNPAKPDHHPNSGVFFRGTPGAYWSGYESQIRNEYKNGDRTQPVDFGTGAIYRKQATRRVVANDGEWFTKTIAASGRFLSVWVNGYPVTSWEDPNPEGTNVRNNEAVLKAGSISLQAHDPTTNLDFRNIRISELK